MSPFCRHATKAAMVSPEKMPRQNSSAGASSVISRVKKPAVLNVTAEASISSTPSRCARAVSVVVSAAAAALTCVSGHAGESRSSGSGP